MKKIDESVGQKFAIAAGMLMTRVFSTEPQPNLRRLAFAYGPAKPARTAHPAEPGPEVRRPGLGVHSRQGVEGAFRDFRRGDA